METKNGDTVMTARYINPYTDFGFKKLFGEEASAEIAKFSSEQLAQYEESLKVYRDLKGVVGTSFEEGKVEGVKEGIEKGIKIGEEQGMQKGEKKRAEKMARMMKSKNYPLEEIAELTDLPPEEIKKL